MLGRDFDLELELNPLFAANAKNIWVDDAGVVEEAPQQIFYRGRVRGEDGSWVRLTLQDDTLDGLIWTADEVYFVEPANRFFDNARFGEMIAYRLSDTESDWTDTSCGVRSPHRSRSKRQSKRAAKRGQAAYQALAAALRDAAATASAPTYKRIQMGLVADFEYYGRHAGASATAMQSIINQVDGVYQREIGVTLEIVQTVVNSTSGDPFSSTPSPNTLLGEFASWKNSNDNSPGQLMYGTDLAHLFTGRDFTDNVVGIAYLSATCRSDIGVGISQDYTTNNNSLVSLTAHEMGHNLSAQHDTNAGCPSGFIMYPVVVTVPNLVDLHFSTCSQSSIATHVNNASCVDTVGAPTPTPPPTATPTRTPTVGVPSVTQPGAGQVLSVSGVTFSWSQVNGATSYDLRVLTLNNGNTVFTGSLAGGSSTSTLISLPNGNYEFRVRACTGGSCGGFGTRQFSVSLLAPAGAPTITAPTAGATLTSSVQTLQWTAVTGSGQLALSYEIELVDVATDLTELTVRMPSNFLQTITALRSGQFRMRVRACEAGCGPYSATVQFTANVPAAPTTAPTITQSAVDGNNQLNAQWTPVGGAEWYELYVVQPPPAGPGGGALTVAARQVFGTSVTVALPVGAANAVVRACSGNGCGPYSQSAAVNPAGPNPNAPQLGQPLAGSVVDGPVVLFTWSRVPGDNGSNTVYRLYAQDLSRGTTALDVQTTNNFYAAFFDAEGARYDALVFARPGTPQEVMGPVVGFNVRGVSPSAPTMVTPTHMGTVAAGNVQVGWTSLPGASLYEYFVAVPGQSGTANGVTPGTFVQVPLGAVGGQPTQYSAIARACPAGATCVAGSDAGWGPWSANAGTGVTNFTVLP